MSKEKQQEFKSYSASDYPPLATAKDVVVAQQRKVSELRDKAVTLQVEKSSAEAEYRQNERKALSAATSLLELSG